MKNFLQKRLILVQNQENKLTNLTRLVQNFKMNLRFTTKLAMRHFHLSSNPRKLHILILKQNRK